MKIMKKNIVPLCIVIFFSISIQGCAELNQGFQRKFHEFTIWVDEMDRKIQRHIRRTGTASTSNEETVTINSLQAVPDIVKQGEPVEIKFVYEIYKKEGSSKKIQYNADLYFYSKRLFPIFDEVIEQDNGRWEDSFSFKVPADAKPGKYEIRYKLAHEKGALQAATFFTVIR